MTPEHVRAFLGRDWAAIAAAKRNYWAERYRVDGALPARQASAALYEHARRLQSAIFGDACRADDLAHHVCVRAQLDRAACAIARR